MIVVAIHQPPYFPWIGLLDKLARADVFVVLDDVQFNKRAFQHRTLYSTPGEARYLSLAARAKGHQTERLLIRDIELDGDGRAPTHFETLRHRYGKSPGWAMLADRLAAILLEPPRLLLDLNLSLLRLTIEVFDIRPRVVLSSSLAADGRKTDLMVSLTQSAGGNTYISGSGADAYMNPAAFDEAGLGLIRQGFVHPTWDQGLSSAFLPGCFALEWYLQCPTTARSAFHAHLKATGTSPPRCLGPQEIAEAS